MIKCKTVKMIYARKHGSKSALLPSVSIHGGSPPAAVNTVLSVLQKLCISIFCTECSARFQDYQGADAKVTSANAVNMSLDTLDG